MQVSVATTILLIKALIWLHDYLKQPNQHYFSHFCASNLKPLLVWD